MKAQKYRLTSEILCVGCDKSIRGPFYLSVGTVVTVCNSDTTPMIEGLCSEGRVQLFAEDLLARAVALDNSIHNCVAA